MRLLIVEGDLLAQPVDVIVNSWNRNFIPWWLLWPQGVSGAIRRQAGAEPFRELSRQGTLKLGDAVVTSAGRLPYRAIIHVAGLDWTWTSSEAAIRLCVRNALAAARERQFVSLAFPLIGAGTGGIQADQVQEWMHDEFRRRAFDGEVRLVRYRPAAASTSWLAAFQTRWLTRTANPPAGFQVEPLEPVGLPAVRETSSKAASAGGMPAAAEAAMPAAATPLQGTPSTVANAAPATMARPRGTLGQRGILLGRPADPRDTGAVKAKRPNGADNDAADEDPASERSGASSDGLSPSTLPSWRQSLGPVRHEHELKLYILVSALDVFATYILLRQGNFTESNPVARYFLVRWGIRGMVYFKFTMVAIVAISCHLIALKRPLLARRILQGATLLVTGVVLYSIWLLVEHGGLRAMLPL